MAWSDAARAAALEVRKRKAKGWYHGGPSIRGKRIRGLVIDYGTDKVRSSTFATSSLREARAYMKAGKHERGAVYSVKSFGSSGNWHVKPAGNKTVRTFGGGFVSTNKLSLRYGQHIASRVPMLGQRLPQGRGRAARPAGKRR